MTSDNIPPAQQPQGRRMSIVLSCATVAMAALAGFGAVYVMARTADNGRAPAAAQVRIAQAPAVPVTTTAQAPLPSGPGVNPLGDVQTNPF